MDIVENVFVTETAHLLLMRSSRAGSNNLGKNRASKRGFLLYYAEWSCRGLPESLAQHERAHNGSLPNNMSTIFINGYIALEEGSDYPTAGGHITFKNLLQVFPQE